MTTTHKTHIERAGVEIPVTLTIEWSRDRRDDMGHGGPVVWWRDNMLALDANGYEVPLTSWERESFSEKYVRELP